MNNHAGRKIRHS